MDRIAMSLLAGVGVLLIYAGYKLFCGLPHMNENTSRASVFLMNIVPGALLALVGTGLVAHGLFSHQAAPAAAHRHRASEGATWHRNKPAIIPRSA
jgi:hypothetical protein